MKNNKKYRLIIVLILFTLLQVGLFNTIISLGADNAQVVEDGTYIIKSAVNDKYVFDVSGESMENEANIALYQYNGNKNQQFKIKYLGNGYYQITAVHSGKSLDVTGYGTKNETNVEQFALKNPSEKNQRWKIVKNADGTYSFVSECNGLYIDIYQGKAANNTNIQMYQKNGQAWQKFKLQKVQENETNTQVKGTKTIEDGNYFIKSAVNNKYVLDVAGKSTANQANVALYEYTGAKNQQFSVKYLNDGYYQITAVHSGKSLSVAGSGTKNETNVYQYGLSNPVANNQKWVIKKQSDGTYSLISACNGLYVDIYQGKAKNNANIQMYQENKQAWQKFKFEKVVEEKQDQGKNNNSNNNVVQGKKTIENGVYSIAVGSSDNFVLDVEGGSKNDCANIQLFKKQSAKRQRFKVEYLGDGNGSI